MLEAGLAHLEEHGINLVHVFDLEGLPVDVTAPLRAEGIELQRYRRLVLMASGGPRLWRALEAAGIGGPDPVDTFSAAMSRTFVRRYLNDTPHRIVYPSACPLPLPRLGALAGWSHASPLGLGIHRRFGLWFAYRAAVLVAAALPPSPPQPGPSPCEGCQTKPCIAACPVGAVRWGAEFDLAGCVSHRLEPQSACARSCAARLACPVGADHRYSSRQLGYHCERSLASIRAFGRGSGSRGG